MDHELRRFVVDNFLYGRDNGFSDDDSMLGMGIIDSTGTLELVSFLEKKYDIVVEDSDLLPQNLDSVARLTQFTRRKLEQKQATGECSARREPVHSE
ncbi:MAG: acyl carrier protein [Acidobacteriia bacterium]|nr:acyl carrier protein [Terriglobia bacterium]